MKPLPKLGLRALILGALLLLIFLSAGIWLVKLFLMVLLAFLVGTVWRSDVREARLERQLILAFVPLRTKRWSLNKFHRIEIVNKPPTSVWAAVGIGMVWWLMWRAFDWLFPWLEATYQLHLRGKTGKRVLAWQGNSESDFDENTERLIEITGFPVQRM